MDLNRKFLWASALVVMLTCQVFAEPLRSIKSVRELAADVADHRLPVEIVAQVLWVDPIRSACFVTNGTQGIYARGQFIGESPQPGDIVGIHGVTHSGGFNAAVLEAEFRVVGNAQLPPATPYDSSLGLSPKVDCDWVAISGRLVSLRVEKVFQLIMVELLQNNDRLHVQVDYSPEMEAYLNELMFDWVELNAVAGTIYNSSRQATGRIFYANSAYDFTLTNYTDAQSNSGTAYAIHELMQPGMEHRGVVNSSGVVTHVGDRVFYLRGERSSLRVEALSTEGLEVGDTVYIEGYVLPQSVSPALSARTFSLVEKGENPIPQVVSLEDTFDTERNYDLIALDALLVDIGQNFGPENEQGNREKRMTLLCRSGDRLFEAQLPPNVELGSEVVVGAKLRLTGICHLIREQNVEWTLSIEGLWLEIRNQDDIQLLVAAPWWTSTRLVGVAVLAMVLAVLFAVWSLILRKTVDRQTKIISQKVEQETVLNERQRMARELHDNLDQGLTGAAIQLQAIRKFFDKSSDKQMDTLKQLIESADANCDSFVEPLNGYTSDLSEDAAKCQKGLSNVQAMLAHCAEESRSSILDLRGGLLERMDLPAALHEALLPLAENAEVRCEIEVTGPVRRLQQKAERHILMVAREASINSLRHAAPKSLHVSLVFAADSLTLSVKDDGCGFNSDGWDKKGHFGLRGMQERVNRLNGKLTVQRLSSGGTEVFVELVSLKEWELHKV